MAWGQAAEGEHRIDPALPDYKPRKVVRGTIKVVGSDTMYSTMVLWGRAFEQLHDGVSVAIEGKGSNTAMPALIGGAASFAAMSRNLSREEIGTFRGRYGYSPLQVPSCVDMVTLFAHRDNEIAGLTLPQLDAVYSQSRRQGLSQSIRTWGDLGLGGDWKQRPVDTYARNSASGTYTYFKQRALAGGDYKATVVEQPGSGSVVQAVSNDRFGLGFCGVGYRTSGVRAVPIARRNGLPFVAPSWKVAYSGEYPLTRKLWLTINHAPGSNLEPLRREFLQFILSQQGQKLVLRSGFFPLRQDDTQVSRGRLQLHDTIG